MSSTRRRRWPRVLAGVFSCLVLVSTGLAVAGELFYNKLNSNITSLYIGGDGGTPPDSGPRAGDPINILVMGSDTREGPNSRGYGQSSIIQGARSDTTILLHISGDRTRALAVSIPRDSKVMLPICKNKAGQQDGGRLTRFNEAFDIGGPGCTVKAVEQLTGTSIDHFVVVDFAGFKNVVNAIGGVDVCLKEPVNDPLSKLRLPAGRSVVKGEQALAFVRARVSLGDGSDIGRIDRQQEFISAAIRKATSLGVVTNPIALFKLLDSATKSLTADPGLANLAALSDLASNVQAIKPADITFTTVPWQYNSDKATVSWVPEKANPLWQAIIDDTIWPPKPTLGADGVPLTVAPVDITVNVLNGSNQVGAATRAAATLRADGYNVGTVGNAPTSVPQTTIANTLASAEGARTLAVAAGTQLVVPLAGKGKTLTLTIGPDFGSLKSVVVVAPKSKVPAAPSVPNEVNVRTADEQICS